MSLPLPPAVREGPCSLFGKQTNWREKSRLERGGWERTGAWAQSPLCPLEPGGYLLLEIKAWKLFWAQFPALPGSRTKDFTCHAQGLPAWGALFWLLVQPSTMVGRLHHLGHCIGLWLFPVLHPIVAVLHWTIFSGDKKTKAGPLWTNFSF